MAESGGTWTQYQKLVLTLLEQHDEKLETLRQQITDSGNDKTVITENINSLKKDVNLLFGLVRDGSSMSPAALARLDVLENDIKILKQSEHDRTTEAANITAWKRALSITLIGILLNLIWNIVQTFFIGK